LQFLFSCRNKQLSLLVCDKTGANLAVKGLEQNGIEDDSDTITSARGSSASLLSVCHSFSFVGGSVEVTMPGNGGGGAIQIFIRESTGEEGRDHVTVSSTPTPF
jgi:hypothetical protein